MKLAKSDLKEQRDEIDKVAREQQLDDAHGSLICASAVLSCKSQEWRPVPATGRPIFGRLVDDRNTGMTENAIE